MQDVFTEKPTCIQGRALPGADECAALQDDHERRLEALARLGAAAEECDLRAHSDPDRDLVLLVEDEVALLESSGPEWAALGDAISGFRTRLPLRRLEDFGFAAEVEHPLEEPNPRLFFLRGVPWLVADLHARNFVRSAGGRLQVIDLVAAPWPAEFGAADPQIGAWLERVRRDPAASALPGRQRPSWTRGRAHRIKPANNARFRTAS